MGERIIMPAYEKPSWMSWKDQGGAYFGGKDVTEALKRGISVADIRTAVEASDALGRGATETTGPGHATAGDLSNRLQAALEAAQGGTLGSGFGQSKEYTGGADLAIYGQGRAGASTGQIAQEIASQANWNPLSMNLSSDIGKVRTSIESAATAQTTADETRAHQASEAAKSKQYYADMLAEQGKQLQAMKDAEAARAADAMKVKYQGSSSVGPGQSAMGIKFKQSPAFASGAASRGTAQLARSGKGSELKTLNV
tara:strand:+ start:1225 stop:1989 length:765 start_codon:yes stop_codon:yes gene_type:complete